MTDRRGTGAVGVTGRAAVRRRGALALLLGGTFLALGGCGTTGPGPDEPPVSPTGIVYDPGTPPTDTRFSQTATLYLRSERPVRAAELAREGIEADPDNPIHHYLAGLAHLRTGDYRAADTLFTEAERLYPAYELEIEPAREAAWAEAFNEGVEAYADGDVDEAIRAWRGAVRIYDLEPEAHRNLAELLVDEGRPGEAVEVYRGAVEGLRRLPATRVLDEAEVERREEEARRMEQQLAGLLLAEERFAEAEPLLRERLTRDTASAEVRQDLARALAGQGEREEAGAIYDGLLAEPDLSPTRLFELAVLLFRTGEFDRASRAFGRLTELRPDSRDIWYNYANALFAAEEWDALVTAGERLLEVDPLGENAGLIVARARMEAGDEDGALRLLERVETAPVFLEGLALRSGPAGATVIGRVTGNEAAPGDPIRLRFTFYGDGGEVGTETVTVPAPDADRSEPLRVRLGRRALWYRYELVDPAS